MPRYHFNDQDGECHLDEDGIELTDLDAARTQAVRTLGGILSENPDQFWQGGEWSMTVTDHTGLTLFRILTVATDGAATARS